MNKVHPCFKFKCAFISGIVNAVLSLLIEFSVVILLLEISVNYAHTDQLCGHVVWPLPVPCRWFFQAEVGGLARCDSSRTFLLWFRSLHQFKSQV